MRLRIGSALYVEKRIQIQIQMYPRFVQIALELQEDVCGAEN